MKKTRIYVVATTAFLIVFGFWLWSGLIAAREVGKGVRTPELCQCFRCATAARSVTNNASRRVNALAVLDIMGPLLDGLGKEKNRARKNS